MFLADAFGSFCCSSTSLLYPLHHLLTWCINSYRQGPCHLGSAHCCMYLALSTGPKSTDYAWLVSQYCCRVGMGEEFSIIYFHLLPLAPALCLPTQLRLRALCQVLRCSGSRDIISSPADKELTPCPTLLQEEDLEGIAASFLRHTQMLSINVGSSAKIVSCYSSHGKNIWIK